MITVLSITASILVLYGVCVTYLLWAVYGEYHQLGEDYKQIRMDRNAEAREANDRLWKLRAANDEVEQLKEELSRWSGRAVVAETKLEQVRAAVK
jgi:hypothetical protein